MRTQNNTLVLSPESQALLLEALPTLEYIARQYAIKYRWTHRLEAGDLTQVAALACLEVLARGLCVPGKPVACLVVVGRRAIQTYCGVNRSLIRSPRTHNGYQPALPVLSLDAPLSAGGEETLLDVLPLV